MIKRFSRFLPKTTYSRGVAVLVGGTAGAQLLSGAAAPILTRLYSPEDFGLLAIFVAMFTILAAISAARYEFAITLPEKDEDAVNVVHLALSCVTLTSLITLVCLLNFSEIVLSALNALELAPYLWLVPIAVFFLGSYEVLSKWALRQKQFGVIAKTKFWQSLGTVLIQLSAFKLGAGGLMGGQAIGQAVGGFSLSISAFLDSRLRNFSLRGVVSQMIRYRSFPLFSTWAALLNVASLQMAAVLFASIYGAATVGMYALTLRILSLPIGLVGNAVSSVFLSSARAARGDGSLPTLVEKTYKKISALSAIPVVALIFFGEELFLVVFSEKWSKAGVYAQWISLWIYAQLQWSPISMLAFVYEMQPQALISQAINFSVRLAAILVAASLGYDADFNIALLAVISALVYFFQIGWFTWKTGVNVMSLLIFDVRYFGFAALVCTSLCLVRLI